MQVAQPYCAGYPIAHVNCVCVLRALVWLLALLPKLQLIGFLDKQDDPHGNTEAARVPEVTSQVAQSICALYEYIRKNSLRLRDIFHGMDRNQNGILDLDEFTGAMQCVSVRLHQT